MPADHVADDEILYRSVRRDQIIPVAGGVRPSSQAFTDRHMEISVDRAKLRDHDPYQSQMSPTDAVVSLRVSDVRGTLPARPEYAIDVRPDPLPENPAHALIYAQPQFANQSVFRRLRERLALLARIELLPDEGDPVGC
jgi:hypothetical protein